MRRRKWPPRGFAECKGCANITQATLIDGLCLVCYYRVGEPRKGDQA